MATELRALDRAARPVDIASSAAFRILFGSVAFVVCIRPVVHGWLGEMYERPRFFFAFEGFSWAHPWPAPWMLVHYVALAVLAILVAAGLFYRASAALFFLGFTYTQALDKTNYLNHNYLACAIAFIVMWLPLHCAGSLDVLLRPSLRRDFVPAWIPWLLRFQLGVVYVFGGLGKLRADWLLDAQPLKIWLASRDDLPVIGHLLSRPFTAHAFSWIGLLFDLAIVPLLLRRRTRPWAYAVLLFFHALTWVLFPIGMFPWIMVLLTTIFFEPDWPRRLLSRMGWRAAALGPGPAVSLVRRSPAAFAARLAGWALACHVLIQVILPLRQHFIPGDVCWHEQGFRFSWNIMLMEKTGAARFFVRSGEEAEEERHCDELLTPLQARMMSTQPDMIVQLARHFAGESERETGKPASVRVEAWASLNGRRHAPLIDPACDLARLAPGASLVSIVPPLPPRE